MLFWPIRWTKTARPPLVEVDKQLDDNPQSLASTLLHYTTPGISPPSARSNPKLQPRAPNPVRLWHLWKYLYIASAKSIEVTGAVIAHRIWGPKKKSWGYLMTIVTTVMRGANRHTALVDIATIRMLMSLAGLVPLPADALVTPVTFYVRQRKLRGILEEFDRKETGNRGLTAEWVVGRQTWLRLQDEWKRSQLRGKKRTLHEKHKKRKERVILYIHGGAYYVSSSAVQRIISIPLAKYTDARVFAIDYRLAPETQFPGPLHDVVRQGAYFRLVQDLHISHENIIVAGDSAGGGLALALLMYLRDNYFELLPSAAILMSPWVDLTMSCESWDSNEQFDCIPMPAPDDHLNPVALYLGANMERYMTHPYASPLFGDFTGLPPMLIQSGDSEVLRDEITLLAHKASLAGVQVQHELYEDAIHVFQLYPFLESTTRSFVSMRGFVWKFLPRIEREAPHRLDEEVEKVIEDEIESTSVIMVGGDGSKTATGMEGVKQSVDHLDTRSPTTDSGSSSDTEEEDNHTKQKEFPSWGRRTWGISSFNLLSPSAQLKPEPRRRAGTLPSSPDFAQGYPTTSALDLKPTYSRTRSHSHINQRPPLSGSLASRRSALPPRINLPSNSKIPSTFGMPLESPEAWLTTNSIPPSPSLRRSSRATSHQDLSSLVRDWTSEGPANRTVIYPSHAHDA